MRNLKLFHARQFSEEIDRLRVKSFVGHYPDGTSRDPFDTKSAYVLVRIDGELVAGGRLSPGPDHYHWTVVKGALPIPHGPDATSFNRVHVAPAFRGQNHDLFELILVDGLLLSAQLGFRWVNGGYRPDRLFKSFIQGLGFKEFGSAVDLCLQSGFTEPSQQLVLEISPSLCAAWTERKASIMARIRGKGFSIEDNGCHDFTLSYESANSSVPKPLETTRLS